MRDATTIPTFLLTKKDVPLFPLGGRGRHQFKCFKFNFIHILNVEPFRCNKQCVCVWNVWIFITFKPRPIGCSKNWLRISSGWTFIAISTFANIAWEKKRMWELKWSTLQRFTILDGLLGGTFYDQ